MEKLLCHFLAFTICEVILIQDCLLILTNSRKQTLLEHGCYSIVPVFDIICWSSLLQEFSSLTTCFFPGGTRGKESACQHKRCKWCGLDFWARKIPWRRDFPPTPIFLPGKFHRLRNRADYSPWGRKESDTTERRYALPGCGLQSSATAAIMLKHGKQPQSKPFFFLIMAGLKCPSSRSWQTMKLRFTPSTDNIELLLSANQKKMLIKNPTKGYLCLSWWSYKWKQYHDSSGEKIQKRGYIKQEKTWHDLIKSAVLCLPEVGDMDTLARAAARVRS